MSTSAPFITNPMFGELSPNEECSVSISFSPTDARQHAAQIVVKSDGAYTAVAPLVQNISVKAHAAFAHLLLEGLPQGPLAGFVQFACI